jgi:hypothetical protein
VSRVIDGGFPEGSHAIAARIVLFFHQHVKVARFGEQSDRLSAAKALLRAIAVLFPLPFPCAKSVTAKASKTRTLRTVEVSFAMGPFQWGVA